MQDVVERKRAALESLNTRIARLAIALGAPLDSDAGLNAALHLAEQQTQQPFHAELRALLTLRLRMEKEWVDELGEATMHQLVVEVEQHMEQRGFRHGVDGVYGERLFDASI